MNAHATIAAPATVETLFSLAELQAMEKLAKERHKYISVRYGAFSKRAGIWFNAWYHVRDALHVFEGWESDYDNPQDKLCDYLDDHGLLDMYYTARAARKAGAE